MGEMIKILFEPSILGGFKVFCLSCGHGMNVHRDEEGPEKGFVKWVTSSFSGKGRTWNGDDIDFSPHIMTCSKCGCSDLAYECTLDPGLLRLKSECLTRMRPVKKEIVNWVKHTWKTKKGKILDVFPLKTCSDSRAKKLEKVGDKWCYPLTTLTETWNRLAYSMSSKYSIEELLEALGEDDVIAKTLSELDTLGVMISRGVKNLIKAKRGLLVVKNGAAHHGRASLKWKKVNNKWVCSAWRKDKSGWHDLCETNAMLDPNNTGEFDIDRGSFRTKEVWVKEPTEIVVGDLRIKTNYKVDVVSTMFDPGVGHMVTEPVELRNVPYIENMDDSDDEDTDAAAVKESLTVEEPEFDGSESDEDCEDEYIHDLGCSLDDAPAIDYTYCLKRIPGESNEDFAKTLGPARSMAERMAESARLLAKIEEDDKAKAAKHVG